MKKTIAVLLLAFTLCTAPSFKADATPRKQLHKIETQSKMKWWEIILYWSVLKH